MSTEIIAGGAERIKPDWTEEVKEVYKGSYNVIVFRKDGVYDFRPYYPPLPQEKMDRLRQRIRQKSFAIIEILSGVNKEGLDVIGRMVYNFTEKAKRGEEVHSTDFRLSEGLVDEFFERA